jgi:hypothetical protein
MSQPIRRAAMEIVIADEHGNGWTPTVIGVAALEKQHGCDILSTPPEGGDPHPVEVKGWGKPFIGVRGRFLYTQDLRASQMTAAKNNPTNFRIEIVANLTRYLAGEAPYERLTLRADEITSAEPRLWEVKLDAKRDEIRLGPLRRSH